MKKKQVMNLHIFDEENNGNNGNGGNSGNGGNGEGSQGGNAGYTFEQAEQIAEARAERATRSALADYFRKNGMSESEITDAIKDFKAKKEANKPNVSAIEKERDEARAELENLKNTNFLRDKGVRADDLDYVVFKVSKLVDDKTDFKKAAEKFLKENPRYAGGNSYRVSTSTGSQGNGNSGSMNTSINDRIRAAMKR